MTNGMGMRALSGCTLLYNVYINGSELFVGLIRLRSTTPPKLQGLEYVLNVTATDDNASGGSHPLTSTARVIVGVDDVNNNKPIFEEVRIWLNNCYFSRSSVCKFQADCQLFLAILQTFFVLF